jgi:drug/metabolite transporter (DMT)-like permease
MSVGGATGGGTTSGGATSGLGIWLVILTALVSGVSTFVNFYAVKGTNSDAFVTARNLTTALFLLPVGFVAARSLTSRLRARDWSLLVVIGLIGGAIPFLLFFRGIELATAAGGAATASFAYRTLFLMATVFGLVFLRERFHWRVTLAAGLILAGNLLLLSLVSPIWTNGTSYVLAATVLWAVEYSVSRRVLRDLPSGTVALGRMGFGAVFLVGYLALTSQVTAVGSLTGGQWQWVLISALLLTAFVGVWYAGLKRVEVGVATSVLVLGFPITFLLSVAFQGSAFTLGQVAGTLIVAVGVGLAVGRTQFREAWNYLARTRLSRPSI